LIVYKNAETDELFMMDNNVGAEALSTPVPTTDIGEYLRAFFIQHTEILEETKEIYEVTQ